MSDDRDFSWVGRPRPEPPPPVEHLLWFLEKRDHRVECRVRATEYGPDLRIVIDGELFWSRMFTRAALVEVQDAAEAKREEFETLGWMRPWPRGV